MPVSLSQFFTKLRLFPSKSEKTVFAANAKHIFCACRKHAKTGKMLRLPVQIPHPYQMPHHMEDLERQIPYSLEKT
jgi:hypothetical protein